MTEERTLEEIEAETKAAEIAAAEAVDDDQLIDLGPDDEGILGAATAPEPEETQTAEELAADAKVKEEAAEAVEAAKKAEESREQGTEETDWDYLQRSRHFSEPEDLAKSYREQERHQTVSDQEKAKYRKTLEQAGYTFDEAGEPVAPEVTAEPEHKPTLHPLTAEQLAEQAEERKAYFDEQFEQDPVSVISSIVQNALSKQMAPLEQRQHEEDMGNLVDTVIGEMDKATPGMGKKIDEHGDAVVKALADMPQAWKASDPKRAIKLAIHEALEGSSPVSAEVKPVTDTAAVEAAKNAAGGGNGKPTPFTRPDNEADEEKKVQEALLAEKPEDAFWKQ